MLRVLTRQAGSFPSPRVCGSTGAAICQPAGVYEMWPTQRDRYANGSEFPGSTNRFLLPRCYQGAKPKYRTKNSTDAGSRLQKKSKSGSKGLARVHTFFSGGTSRREGGSQKLGRYNFDAKMALVDITPEMAKRWLEKNTGNRAVNQRHVDVIAKDISDGDWDVTNQSIGIASDGSVVDGQHRLLAIVKANKTTRSYVLFNAPKSMHLDSGLKRTESNRLQMGDDGLTWVNARILAPINLIKSVYPKIDLEQSIKKDAWLRKYEDIVKTCATLAKRSKIQRFNNAGIMACFIVAMMNGVPESYIRRIRGALVQLAEPLAHNRAVAGSMPARPTRRFPCFSSKTRWWSC